MLLSLPSAPRRHAWPGDYELQWGAAGYRYCRKFCFLLPETLAAAGFRGCERPGGRPWGAARREPGFRSAAPVLGCEGPGGGALLIRAPCCWSPSWGNWGEMWRDVGSAKRDGFLFSIMKKATRCRGQQGLIVLLWIFGASLSPFTQWKWYLAQRRLKFDMQSVTQVVGS